MKTKHYITLMLSFILPIAPQLVLALPAAYRDMATGLLAFLAAYYHYLQEPPKTT